MKAITTRFLGPSYTKPSRIIARDEDGNRFSASVSKLSDWGRLPHIEDVHAAAAIALCRKMNWHGSLIGGSIKGGYVFLSADSPQYSTD